MVTYEHCSRWSLVANAESLADAVYCSLDLLEPRGPAGPSPLIGENRVVEWPSINPEMVPLMFLAAFAISLALGNRDTVEDHLCDLKSQRPDCSQGIATVERVERTLKQFSWHQAPVGLA